MLEAIVLTRMTGNIYLTVIDIESILNQILGQACSITE